MIVLRSLIISLAVAVVVAHPLGAPQEACWAVAPGGEHVAKGDLPQTSVSPYYLDTHDSSYYYPGSPVRVTVSSKNPSSYFKGFLIRSYDDMGNSFGTFTSADSHSQTRKCDIDGDAATHTSSSSKSTVDLYWHPPVRSSSSYVRFQMSVLESEYKFWTNLEASMQAEHNGVTMGSPRPNVLTVWGLLTAIVGALWFRQVWTRM